MNLIWNLNNFNINLFRINIEKATQDKHLKLLTNALKNKKFHKNKEYITISLICSDILTLIFFFVPKYW
jgi:hypothetical protein